MIRRAALSVVSLIVFCLVLECVLRTTHLFHARLSWTEPDREIGWRFTPAREYWFFGENDHAITGRINSMGWRDRERSVHKPPHTYRIAVLGDSFVEAFQVELDSTFVAIAERRLNAAGNGKYEVMNFGRSGMSQAEELIVLERDVLPCDPDVVVLLFTPRNDIADINPATTTDLCRPFFHRVGDDSLVRDTSFTARRDFRIREAINPFKQHSALISLVSERYNAWRLARAARRVSGFRDPRLTLEQALCTSAPDSVSLANYALCKRLIARMARTCAGVGTELLVASVPIVSGRDSTLDLEFFDRDLAKLGAANGFRVADLTGPFMEGSRHGNRFNWQHWNYAGHRLVGGLLAGAVRSEASEPPGRGVDSK